MTEKRHPGAVDVAGELYLRDAKGNLVPLTAVKPVDLLVDELVCGIIQRAQVMSDALAQFRAETFEQIRSLQELPDQQYGATVVITRWIEIGMTAGGGMAPAALSWLEINEWQKATGTILCPWEAHTIHALSVAYVGKGRRAEEETCPPPWRAPYTPQERAAEEAALLAFFRRN